MTIRPPKALAQKTSLPEDPLAAALEHEIRAEKMGTYSRLVKRLEQALAALREFEAEAEDALSPSPPGASRGSERPPANRVARLDARDRPRHDGGVARRRLPHSPGSKRDPGEARPRPRVRPEAGPRTGSDGAPQGALAVSEKSQPSKARREARPRRPGREARGTAVSENETATRSGDQYEALLDAAGEALWYVMIQRDLCGFRRHDLFFRELGVPAAVRLRMGLVRSR